MLNELLGSFSELEDPRCDYKVEHNLLDILVITICAVIACAESWWRSHTKTDPLLLKMAEQSDPP